MNDINYYNGIIRGIDYVMLIGLILTFYSKSITLIIFKKQIKSLIGICFRIVLNLIGIFISLYAIYLKYAVLKSQELLISIVIDIICCVALIFIKPYIERLIRLYYEV